jgi:hypothetical protein
MRSLRLPVAMAIGLECAASRPAVAGDLASWLAKRLSVQQVVKDKNSVDKPAFLSLTYPRDGPPQKEASVGVVLDLVSTETMKTGPAVELQEKTHSDKPQSLLTAGWEGSWTAHLGPQVEVPAAGVFVSRFALRTEMELKYKKDGVAKTKGLAGAVRWTVTSPASLWRWGPYLIFRLVGPFRFKWEPRIGFEYDDVIAAKVNEPEGATVRTYSELGLYLYPFGRSIGDRLVFSATLAHRRDLSTPAAVAADNHYFRTYSGLVYIDAGRRFAIGADRVSGQDPAAGFREQRFNRVSFKLRLKP